VEIISGEIRAEIGSMSEDRAVLHKTVAEKYTLAVNDVLVGEKYLASLLHSSRRDRWLIPVRSVRQEA